MNDEARSEINGFLKRAGRTELEPEDVEEVFEDKLDKVEARAMEDLNDRQKIEMAVGMMGAEDLAERRTGGDGEEADLKILAIGHRGTWDDHPVTDERTVTAHAVIHGAIGEDGQERAAKAILFLTESDVDLVGAQSKFHALNTMEATFDVEEAWNLDGFYRCYSSDATELHETEIDDLPSDRSDKNDLLRRMFPGVDLADLAENGEGLSAYDAESDGNYTQDFGADIKRFRGTVADYYINDENTWGVYTLLDDSVTPEDIEDTPVVGENQSVPGLSVHCDPDYHMNVGEQSVVDVYGVTEIDNNGQIIMRAAGVVPIVPMDMEDETADADVQSTTEEI